MFLRVLTTAGLMGALALTPAKEAQADAGDFIGGAIVGGLIGHAITKDQQRKKTTTVRRTYAPRIPVTEHGRQTQTALNYFGFNAGAVDGQIGNGTRRAIERYQASMGYPVNGRDFQPYQFDELMQAYYWALNGGQVQTRLTGQPLLMAYRTQIHSPNTVVTVQPQQVPQVTTVVVPQPTTTVVAPEPTTTVVAPELPVLEASNEPAASGTGALPNLFAGSQPQVSLANHCNGVMLQTSTNGGYMTLATMSDADFALSEQFCLARSYAMARGEELMGQITGLSPQQIATQCVAFGDMLKPQADAVSLTSPGEAQSEMRKFALESGISPTDLVSTARVCLSVGYAQDNMTMALGSALMLASLGEKAYGELLGHHLREGVGAPERTDLAMAWYDDSLGALEGGAQAVFMPSLQERSSLIRQATLQLDSTEQSSLGGAATVPASTLPTFTVGE